MSPGGRADTWGRVPPGKAAVALAKKKRSREPNEDPRISSKETTHTEKNASPASPHIKKKKLVEPNTGSKQFHPSSSPSSSASTVSAASLSSSGSRMNPSVKSTKKRQRDESEAAREAPVDEKIGGYVSSTLLRKALGGLTGYVLKKSREQHSQNLLQEAGASTVSLMLALKNIPEAFRKKPVQIVLPHALLDTTGGGGEVCLFVRDPQRKWKDLLANERLPLITRVIGISKVKKKFPTFQDRRVLCAAYDMFLCDRRISDKLTPLLGKPFIQSKKLPLPIKVSADNIRPSIEEALRSTYFFLPRGPCVAIKIGRANMPVEHLFDNAKTALNAAFDFFSGDSKFQNVVHAVSVQATNAPALPLYTHASYAQAAQHYISTKPPATKLGKAGKPKAGSTPASSPTKEETKSGDMGKKKKIGENGTVKQAGATATKKNGPSEKLNGKLAKGDRLNGNASENKYVRGMSEAGEVASGAKKSGVTSVAKEAKRRPLATTPADKKTSVGSMKGNKGTKKRKVEKA